MNSNAPEAATWGHHLGLLGHGARPFQGDNGPMTADSRYRTVQSADKVQRHVLPHCHRRSMVVCVSFCLALGLVARLAFAVPETPVHRQSSALLGSLWDFCADYDMDGSKLTALCVASVGVPNYASIDLNQCLNNEDGALGFGR